jgi:hypothetical protein
MSSYIISYDRWNHTRTAAIKCSNESDLYWYTVRVPLTENPFQKIKQPDQTTGLFQMLSPD